MRVYSMVVIYAHKAHINFTNWLKKQATYFSYDGACGFCIKSLRAVHIRFPLSNDLIITTLKTIAYMFQKSVGLWQNNEQSYKKGIITADGFTKLEWIPTINNVYITNPRGVCP